MCDNGNKRISYFPASLPLVEEEFDIAHIDTEVYCVPSKNPTIDSKTSTRRNESSPSLVIASDDTPTRGLLRANASLRQASSSKKWKNGAREGNTALSIGAIVTVEVPKVDRGKTDPRNIQGVVVEATEHDNYRIGVKGGVLQNCFFRGQLKHNITATPTSTNLQEILDTWSTAKKIGIREALRWLSPTGGQGFTKCNCKKSCFSNACACYKAKRLCNSRCHPSNHNCKNCGLKDDSEAEDEDAPPKKKTKNNLSSGGSSSDSE